MKIIDFEKKGNVVRFYVGSDNLENYYGDDWDDRPYEHNAGEVYDEFCLGYFDKAFGFGDEVMEPADGATNGNSCWCKDDMRERRVPCICVLPEKYKEEYKWYYSFDDIANDEHTIKYFFGDKVDEEKEDIHLYREIKNESIRLAFTFDGSYEFRKIVANTFATILKSGAMAPYDNEPNKVLIEKIDALKDKDYKKMLTNIIKIVHTTYGFDGDIKEITSSLKLVTKNTRYIDEKINKDDTIPETRVIVNSGDEWEIGKVYVKR